MKNRKPLRIGIILVAIFSATPEMHARAFRRSFKNGYPAEWNISTEQAEDTFSIKGRTVTYSNGKGLTITTDDNSVSQRTVRIARPHRKSKRIPNRSPRTPQKRPSPRPQTIKQ